MYHPVHAFTKKVQYRNPEKFGPGKYFCLMGVLYMDICILVIHGEFINGRGYTKYFQKALCLQLGFNIFSLVLMLKQLGIVLKWQHQQSI